MPDVTHRLIGDTDQDYKIHITPRSCDRDHHVVSLRPRDNGDNLYHLELTYISLNSKFYGLLQEKFITLLIRSLQDWHGDVNIALD